jgi:tetratricopeptide (TPR) repeat protein
MAGGKEHRMVFDIRGRRKHVVRVVYAILAVLMGASLFLVLGPVNIAGLVGSSGGTSEAGKIAIEQAERYERKLKKSPEDPELLLALTRARISAGTSSQEINRSTGEITPTLETRQQYAKASEAWSRYLKATDEPSAGMAQQVAPALFRLGEISPNPNQILSNFEAAADTQQIVVERQPNPGAISKYALYRMYAGDFAIAEKAAAKAEKGAQTKFEREGLENKLEEVKKAIQKFKKQIAANNKASQGEGKQRIESPLGGLGAGGGLAE